MFPAWVPPGRKAGRQPGFVKWLQYLMLSLQFFLSSVFVFLFETLHTLFAAAVIMFLVRSQR